MSRLRQALGLEARSYENPAVPLSGRNLALLGSAGGLESEAGPMVGEGSALTYSAVFACVRVLAEGVGVLPLAMYRQKGPEEREEAQDHPAHQLLHVQPNPEQTPAVFKETLQGHLGTWGNAYARIEWDGRGEPKALWPLEPSVTRAQRLLGSYQLRYTTVWRGKQLVLDPAEVLHVPGLGFDGVTGYSPVGLLRNAVGIGLAAEQFTSRFYRNGAWFSGFFEHPDQLEDEAHKHVQESLHKAHAGAANAFRPLILEEGMKWHQVTLPGEDALFLSLRKLQRREVAACYRVPPHMIADLEGGASYSSIEQMSLDFVTYSLAVWLAKWEQECTRKLQLAPSYYARFNLDALLRADTAGRYGAYKVGREGGWLSANDVRRRENMKPIEGGDTYLEPRNAAPLGSQQQALPAPAPAPKPPPAKRPAGKPAAQVGPGVKLLAVLEDVAGRGARRQADRVRRAGKKPVAELRVWASGFFAGEEATTVAALLPAAEALALAVPGGAALEAGERTARVQRALRGAVAADLERAQADTVRAHHAGQLEPLLAAWAANRSKDLATTVAGAVARALEEPTT